MVFKLALAAMMGAATMSAQAPVAQKSATQKSAVQKSADVGPMCEACCDACSPIVIRTFERREEDNARRDNYKDYCAKLDAAWREYRAAGSTPEAFAAYQVKAAEAKRDYVVADPYLVPIFE